jgi:protein-disulfide isomerase
MFRRSRTDLRALVASPLAMALALLFVAGAGGTLAFFPREVVSAAGVPEPVTQAVATQTQRSEFDRWFAAQPRVPLVIPTEGAKVLIVKFNDFQCPACAQSFLQYKPILARCEAEHPGAVKLVLKDYPLNRDCNDNIPQTMHASACDAAVAVRLARLHDRGDAMEDWFFTHQPEMTPSSVRQAARDIGQVTDFDAQYNTTLSLVKGDVALGRTLALRATPTFFINGVRIDSVLAPQYFDEAVNYELEHAGTK